MPAQPSNYELGAWSDIQAFRGRQASRGLGEVSQKMANGASTASERASKYLGAHPRAHTALERGQSVVAKSGRVVSAGARSAKDAIPGDWTGAAAGSFRRTAGKLSRAGLSSKRVVAKHQKRGHDVSALRDLRALDLEQIDIVKGRAAAWLYPAGAAMSGAGAGLVISGGELITAASAGAAAAPSGAAITGALVGDAAAVLALGSRIVGRTALMYGYDPEDPAEKLFILTVVNAGSAVSAGAKTAAFADISKLTQALVRGQTWAVLNESMVAKVAQEFAKRFSFRLTKQGLGKVVPAAGILVGGALNWATLEGIVDAADVAYRRRFLLEKYPKLGDGDRFGIVDIALDAPDESDQPISVLAEIAEAGGPEFD